MRRLAADFALLYPPYTWIPACAGMTISGACRGVLEPASATPWEVEHSAEIAAPSRHGAGEWLAMTGQQLVGAGRSPAGSLRVSLSSKNSLESLFDKEGLREFGGRGLTYPPHQQVAPK
jgi:hypothetical protein